MIDARVERALPTGTSYPDERSRSSRLHDRAERVMPGGSTRSTVFRRPYPLYAAFGHGSRIVDVDGVERIDFVNNYTALIHGHAHPRIVRAAVEATERGSCFGAPTELEIRLAESLTDRIASAEQIRFTNSGTEAVMMAVKAARAFTGRRRIAKCEGAYHGGYDAVDVSVGPSAERWGPARVPRPVPDGAGTLGSDTVVIPFNDGEAALEILARHASELAAVVVDPLPNRLGLIPASAAFLGSVRRFCDENGVPLISDEIISFRLDRGGAQAAFGYTADITTLGKLIGGGFPVGAVAGSADLMAVFDPRPASVSLPHAGTFNANPVTMAAGLAALELLTTDVIAGLNELGERCRAVIREAIAAAGVPWQVVGEGSLFRIHPTVAPLRDYRSTRVADDARALLTGTMTHLLNLGVFVDAGGFGCLSTAMDEQDVADLGSTLSRALSRRKDGEV
jgi:glutamate-1-semialdehyde 2,1-aminomutase